MSEHHYGVAMTESATNSPRPKSGYVGWAVSDATRTALLEMIAPVYPTFKGHHVTLAIGVNETVELPAALTGHVIGVADDKEGVQALVVVIDGVCRRPDGSIYHITWSLADGRKPKESNDVIRQLGWIPVPAFRIDLEPAFFPDGVSMPKTVNGASA